MPAYRLTGGDCGRCKQRAHTYCTLPCTCAERGHGRAYDADVTAFLGLSGYYGADDRDAPTCEHPSRVCRHAPVMSDGWTFIWNARAGAYRYVTNRATTRDLMREDNGRARSIARTRRTRTAQPKRAVAIGSVWNVRATDRAIAPAARASRVTALARGGYGL